MTIARTPGRTPPPRGVRRRPATAAAASLLLPLLSHTHTVTHTQAQTTPYNGTVFTLVFPSLVPINTTVTIHLMGYTLPGYTPSISANPRFALPSSSGNHAHTGTHTCTRARARDADACVGPLTVGNATGTGHVASKGVTVYAAPRFAAFSAPTLTSAGLTPVTLVFEPDSPFLPRPAPIALVQCLAAGAAPPQAGRVWERTLTLAEDGTPMFDNKGDAAQAFEYTAITALHENRSAIVFSSQTVPSTGCSHATVWLSYNGGAHYHATGFDIPVSPVSPLKIVSLYPYTIGASPWVATHNAARIRMTSLLQGVVDGAEYVEESWRLPALPSGRLVDPQFFDDAITVQNASLILCAGTQYLATATNISRRYPHVSILIMSTVRQVVPAMPNLAFATGRMYEAMFVAGFVAASSSRTGRLGMLLSLEHPSSYAFVNAFYLGVTTAVQDGFVPAGVTPQVYAWTIGAFSDEWAEKHGAIDLLDRFGVDILFPVTDSPRPQQECHARGCFSLGFNADERQQLGDRVLISVVYQLSTIYAEFVSRIINGKSIGPDVYSAGLGRGVDVTATSPNVPIAATKQAERYAEALRAAPDDTEKIFCGALLLDARGGVRLNATASGKFRDCLPADVVNRMNWVLQGVTHFGLYVPPPLPTGPTPVRWTQGPAVVVPMALFGSLTIFVAVFASVGVIKYRRVDAIRFSSPLFLIIINIGAIGLGALQFWLAFSAPTTDICRGNIWLSGCPFTLMFGSLFSKTSRMNRLFNNTQLRRLRITLRHVLQLLGLVLAAEIVLLLILTFVFPRDVVVVVHPRDSSGATTFLMCTASPAAARGIDGATILYALHLVLLIWGAYLAFRTRNLPMAFNESRYIGMSIYNVILCEVLALVIDAAAPLAPEVPYFKMLLRFGVPPLVTLLLLYVPKFYAVWNGFRDHFVEPDGTVDRAALDAGASVTKKGTDIAVNWMPTVLQRLWRILASDASDTDTRIAPEEMETGVAGFNADGTAQGPGSRKASKYLLPLKGVAGAQIPPRESPSSSGSRRGGSHASDGGGSGSWVRASNSRDGGGQHDDESLSAAVAAVRELDIYTVGKYSAMTTPGVPMVVTADGAFTGVLTNGGYHEPSENETPSSSAAPQPHHGHSTLVPATVAAPSKISPRMKRQPSSQDTPVGIIVSPPLDTVDEATEESAPTVTGVDLKRDGSPRNIGSRSTTSKSGSTAKDVTTSN